MNAWHAAVVMLLVAAPAPAQDLARLDQVMKSYPPALFMGTVLVARDGEIIFNKSYGLANIEWNIPNTPPTRFRIGSLTKQFTAASILLLEERGKLKIADPVKTYLPDAPVAWDKITVFNLLTHTSGIPNFTSLPEYATMERLPTPVERIVQRFRDRPLDFPPGERMSYSNSGYILLGQIIEKLSGGTYEKFVQDNLFTPLGMKDSGYDSNSAIIARRASGYTPGPRGLSNAAFVDMSVPFAAGALYSTTEDLLRWQRGLYGGKVVSAASLQKMTTPFKSDYAFGLSVRTVNGVKQIAHPGGIQGFNAWLSYYPDEKLTVAILGNVNGQAVDDIAAKFGTLLHGGAVTLPSERKEIQVPPAALAAFVGTYELQGIQVVITLEGDHLAAQVTDQPKIPLFAESETTFFFKVVDAVIEFDKGASPAAFLILRQNGREMRGTRKN